MTTPKMNPINCKNGQIVAAFEVIENEQVLETKNTWDLLPISPIDLKTTICNRWELDQIIGKDLLNGFSRDTAPTRKWLFFQDILMLERLSRDLLTDNYATVCNGISLYMANNPFALMKSCFVDDSQQMEAWAVRLEARNGRSFYWIKGGPNLTMESDRYKMIRYMGLNAEFETSNERSDPVKRKTKMSGKQKNHLLIRKNLGDGYDILITQEYDQLSVNCMPGGAKLADIIEVKTWKKGDAEEGKELDKNSFYAISKLMDLTLLVLWNEKEWKNGEWNKCTVKSFNRYPVDKLFQENKSRLDKAHGKIRSMIAELEKMDKDVVYITIVNKQCHFKSSNMEEFIWALEGQSEIGEYVKSTLNELTRHHQESASRRSSMLSVRSAAGIVADAQRPSSNMTTPPEQARNGSSCGQGPSNGSGKDTGNQQDEKPRQEPIKKQSMAEIGRPTYAQMVAQPPKPKNLTNVQKIEKPIHVSVNSICNSEENFPQLGAGETKKEGKKPQFKKSSTSNGFTTRNINH